MLTKRLSMRQLREILRLHLQSQLGVRHIHRSLRLSVGVVLKTLNKAQELSLDWHAIQKFDEVEAINNICSKFYLKYAMSVNDVPCEATLRQRMDKNANAFLPILKTASIDSLTHIDPAMASRTPSL
jgi:hypothetical protein